MFYPVWARLDRAVDSWTDWCNTLSVPLWFSTGRLNNPLHSSQADDPPEADKHTPSDNEIMSYTASHIKHKCLKRATLSKIKTWFITEDSKKLFYLLIKQDLSVYNIYNKSTNKNNNSNNKYYNSF